VTCGVSAGSKPHAFVLVLKLCTACPQARRNKSATNREPDWRPGTRPRRRCAEPSQAGALVDPDRLESIMATMWPGRYSSDATVSNYRSRK
jgi:hypothetical protein